MHYYVVLASMKTIRQSVSDRRRLGVAVRQRRKRLGMSQERFAEKVDCHRNYIGLVERGEQNITIDMLGRIARGLGCSVADLAGEAQL